MTSPDGFVAPDPHERGGQNAEARNVVRAFADGLSNLGGPILGRVVGGIRDALRGTYTGEDPALNGIQDGQIALRNRQDLMSPLLDYGSCYMRPVTGWSTTGVLPFDQQLAAMQGVEMLDGGGFRLLDRGVWDIRAQITFSWINILSGVAQWRIIVRAPDGSFHSEQVSVQANISDQNTPAPIISSVVVPEEGYTVRVELQRNANYREVLGGPAYSRLTVQHISRSTSGDSDADEEEPIEED